jgi:hypothetical protein
MTNLSMYSRRAADAVVSPDATTATITASLFVGRNQWVQLEAPGFTNAPPRLHHLVVSTSNDTTPVSVPYTLVAPHAPATPR